jgi:hypothetical protein
VLLVTPVPARLKEWAYAGFAINLGSALIAHVSVGDGPEAWGWAAATGVLWGLSYFFWRRLQATDPSRSFAAGSAPVRAQNPPQATPTDHLKTFVTSPVLALMTTLRVCLPSGPS